MSRAYSEGAGLGTAGDGWAPSTRDMVPWDGAALDPHYAPIEPSRLKPGDLVLYDTCPAGEACPYRHVVLYLGSIEDGGLPMMAHTNSCAARMQRQNLVVKAGPASLMFGNELRLEAAARGVSASLGFSQAHQRST